MCFQTKCNHCYGDISWCNNMIWCGEWRAIIFARSNKDNKEYFKILLSSSNSYFSNQYWNMCDVTDLAWYLSVTAVVCVLSITCLMLCTMYVPVYTWILCEGSHVTGACRGVYEQCAITIHVVIGTHIILIIPIAIRITVWLSVSWSSHHGF